MAVVGLKVTQTSCNTFKKLCIRRNNTTTQTKASVTDMLDRLGWRSLEQRRVDSRLCLMYKLAYNLIPLSHKDQLRPPKEEITPCTRNVFSTSTMQYYFPSFVFLPQNNISMEQSSESFILSL